MGTQLFADVKGPRRYCLRRFILCLISDEASGQIPHLLSGTAHLETREARTSGTHGAASRRANCFRLIAKLISFRRRHPQELSQYFEPTPQSLFAHDRKRRARVNQLTSSQIRGLGRWAGMSFFVGRHTRKLDTLKSYGLFGIWTMQTFIEEKPDHHGRKFGAGAHPWRQPRKGLGRSLASPVEPAPPSMPTRFDPEPCRQCNVASPHESHYNR